MTNFSNKNNNVCCNHIHATMPTRNDECCLLTLFTQKTTAFGIKKIPNINND